MQTVDLEVFEDPQRKHLFRRDVKACNNLNSFAIYFIELRAL